MGQGLGRRKIATGAKKSGGHKSTGVGHQSKSEASKQMLTKDERIQSCKFQDAIGAVVDAYLREGMLVSLIKEVLRDEANSDLDLRRKELERDD
jgi:hypothetical protein